MIFWLVTQLKIDERASIETFRTGDTLALGENKRSVLIEEDCRIKDIPYLEATLMVLL